VERDLGVHLETALRGVLIGERWPKSGVEVIVTIIEGDEDAWWGDHYSSGMSSAGAGWGLLNVLAGCITVASAAIADAEIDCVDMVTGGVAAIVRDSESSGESQGDSLVVLDPCPAEHQEIVAACAVGYLSSRDEITEIWLKGDVGAAPEDLIEKATQAATASLSVLKETLTEAVERKFKGELPQLSGGSKKKAASGDVEMTG
jgi:exosome complex component MTR3